MLKNVITDPVEYPKVVISNFSAIKILLPGAKQTRGYIMP